MDENNNDVKEMSIDDFSRGYSEGEKKARRLRSNVQQSFSKLPEGQEKVKCHYYKNGCACHSGF